jgi:hypothetical protein
MIALYVGAFRRLRGRSLQNGAGNSIGLKMKRECGGCNLCCRALPIEALKKNAGTRCQYQRFGKGCVVHGNLEKQPYVCRAWSCRWLIDETATELRRPDRVHYFIDPTPDFVVITGVKRQAVQVWVDPLFPDAHRDAGLRSYIERTAKIAVVRLSAENAFVVVAPSLSETGEWLELRGQMTDAPHSVAEIAEAMVENVHR